MPAVSESSEMNSSLLRARRQALRSLPHLAVLGLASGVANAVLIFAISACLGGASIEAEADRFFIAAAVYLWTRRAVEKRLIESGSDIVFDMRIELLSDLLSRPLLEFENADRGRLHSLICEDTVTLGNAVNVVVGIVTSGITTAAVFAYLFTLDFTLAALTSATILCIAWSYGRRSQTAKVMMHAARASWDVYVGHIQDAFDGFKELALNSERRECFEQSARRQCEQYRADSDHARYSLLDAFLHGESLLLGALAAATFVLPFLFGLSTASRTGFVVALLYLIGPVRSLLSLIPAAIQAKVAWRRLASLPASRDQIDGVRPAPSAGTVGTLELVDVRFQYPESGGYAASVGPVSLRLGAGEKLFIAGGNGSGKTTLAKVICGLYPPSSGRVMVDGKPVTAGEDSGFFAVTFNPCFVFRHEHRGGGDPREASQMWLRFELPRYGTDEPLAVNQLSSGQRKRVAIGDAILQKRSILIFDEPAADQAPEFRSYFYDTLLRDLTAAGKIVIVITHDQAYFHLADQLLSLDVGRVVSQFQMRGELSASGR